MDMYSATGVEWSIDSLQASTIHTDSITINAGFYGIQPAAQWRFLPFRNVSVRGGAPQGFRPNSGTLLRNPLRQASFQMAAQLLFRRF